MNLRVKKTILCALISAFSMAHVHAWELPAWLRPGAQITVLGNLSKLPSVAQASQAKSPKAFSWTLPTISWKTILFGGAAVAAATIMYFMSGPQPYETLKQKINDIAHPAQGSQFDEATHKKLIDVFNDIARHYPEQAKADKTLFMSNIEAWRKKLHEAGKNVIQELDDLIIVEIQLFPQNLEGMMNIVEKIFSEISEKPASVMDDESATVSCNTDVAEGYKTILGFLRPLCRGDYPAKMNIFRTYKPLMLDVICEFRRFNAMWPDASLKQIYDEIEEIIS